jgi:predicted CXXCH cytochrome family protein
VAGMLVADQKTVCFKCHAAAGKDLASAKSVHAAFAKGDCSKCHSPHAAKLKKLLLAQSPDLCFSCHKDIKARMDKDKVHSPASDCMNCHKPHGSKEARLQVAATSELCGQCHDFKEKGFTAKHIGIDPKVIECMGCHDPHASKDPKFFKAKMHPPFAARECDTCHVAPKK